MPADSCFAQAVSNSAATAALRASLVFIDRYPGKQELYGNARPCGSLRRPVPEASERKFYRSPGTIGNTARAALSACADKQRQCMPLKGQTMPEAPAAHARELAKTFGPHLASVAQRTAELAVRWLAADVEQVARPANHRARTQVAVANAPSLLAQLSSRLALG